MAFKKLTNLFTLSVLFIIIHAKVCFAQELLKNIDDIKKDFNPTMIELYTHNWEGNGLSYLIKNSGEFIVCNKKGMKIGACFQGKLSFHALKELKQMTNKKKIFLWKNKYKSDRIANRGTAGGYVLIITRGNKTKTVHISYTANIPQGLSRLIKRIEKINENKI